MSISPILYLPNCRIETTSQKQNDEKSDEIMRIAGTQVLVTACMNTEDGDCISVRQSTEAEEKLSTIYSLLDVNPHPLGKIKSVVHLKLPSKKTTTLD